MVTASHYAKSPARQFSTPHAVRRWGTPRTGIDAALLGPAPRSPVEGLTPEVSRVDVAVVRAGADDLERRLRDVRLAVRARLRAAATLRDELRAVGVARAKADAADEAVGTAEVRAERAEATRDLPNQVERLADELLADVVRMVDNARDAAVSTVRDRERELGETRDRQRAVLAQADPAPPRPAPGTALTTGPRARVRPSTCSSTSPTASTPRSGPASRRAPAADRSRTGRGPVRGLRGAPAQGPRLPGLACLRRAGDRRLRTGTPARPPHRPEPGRAARRVLPGPVRRGGRALHLARPERAAGPAHDPARRRVREGRRADPREAARTARRPRSRLHPDQRTPVG
ncbi:hypothetical protein FRAAL4185 [Frankia alni ACN14a]|uniref:Uncharacterized protein n=1 Tax=Frankia alni (strain DSM 45986 / CECT 9034 / ACN14a) TaxID=326424 RepID=Q0RI45_FRAAA|nr:hypothetical protein FRAAL4185 [Frankia alni ACN14a]